MKHIEDIELAENLRVVISRLVKILRTQTKNDELLSLTESSTLAVIHDYKEILPSELAAAEKVTAQSMSQIINKLLDHGFIKRTSSKTDKRKVLITITAAGMKAVEERRSERQEWLARSIGEKTTKKEKEVLMNAIAVMAKLVNLQ
ncbi:MAG: MarR family transcriptional regulator [Bacteroidota bacterium]|jgi:DNA-binding MarR family transcriptional regulator